MAWSRFSRFGSWEAAFYLLLVLIAAAMRLWALEVRPFHYDESLHAYYSWKLFTGQGYQHDPMMHGPFQFEVTALSFWLLGDSDFTARLPAAVVGSLLVGLPYFLRRELGRVGAGAVSVLLALSPAFLYFSRFARTDIYIAFWSLLLVVCLMGYLREGKHRYLYLAAAALSLAFATKEVSYLLLVIFLGFLLLISWRELGRGVRAGFAFSSLSPAPSLFLLLFSLTLPLYAPALSLVQGVLGVTLANRDPALGFEGQPLGAGVAVAAAALFFAFVLAFSLGLRWRPRPWIGCFAIFWGLYILLYSTFFANYKGLGTGVWGSFAYWLVQHGKDRLSQPFFYYPFLLSTYEFLVLVLAGAATVYYLRRRRWRGDGFPFFSFLLFWAGGSLALFSYAGEKAPWLLLHLSLPLTLLGGKLVGEGVSRGMAWLPGKIGVALLLLLLFLSLRVAIQASYAREDRPVEALVFAQASFEVARLRPHIEEVLGRGGALYTDAGLDWPWQWYLRRYKRVYSGLPSPLPSPATDVVFVVSPSNESRLGELVDGHLAGQRYRHLLWFAEDYRQWRLKDWLGGRALVWWGRYWLFRESPPYWASTGVAFLPR